MSYLHKHPKNGGYWFQRGIPARIRHIIGRGTTYRENLKTKDEAIARQRLRPIEEHVDALFEQAQKQVDAKETSAPPPTVLNPMTSAALVAAWKNDELLRRAEAYQSDWKRDGTAFREECRLLGVEDGAGC
jgi:hypothetical protein